jgi:hypothetical protein
MFSTARKRISKKKSDLEIFFSKHKSRLAWSTFLAGFLIDVVTLNRIDALFGNIILSFYLLLAILSIVLSNWGDYNDIKNKFLYKIYQYSPLITQFSFGALFSGFVVYYTTSGSLVASWPFLLVLYLVFVVNEKVQKYYEKFEFQISVFFASFFAFSIFFLPIVAKKIGDEIFIASGAITVFFTFWVVRGIFKILPVLKKKKKKIMVNIFFVFFIVNLAYFFQVIPPVPLSIKEMEVVHKTGRNDEGKYFITREKKSWSDFYKNWKNTFYIKKEGEVYFFVSVFAPSGLKADIFHHWEFFDIKGNNWKTIQRVGYEIVGGRGDGYRGYSFISEAENGEWRVSVENSSGFLMGRENFKVINSERSLEMESIILK